MFFYCSHKGFGPHATLLYESFIDKKVLGLIFEEYCHADSDICIVNVSVMSQDILRSIRLDTIYGP